jgi:hypothetical protein
MAARVGIVLLVIMVIGGEIVPVLEARQLGNPSIALNDGRVVAANGESAGVWASSKWNMRRTLGGDKRTVPGGPDPQHHY